MRLFQLEDVQDSLKNCSRLEVVGREIVQDLFTSRSSWKEDDRDSLKKERDFHHHYPAGGGVVDKNRRCNVKPDKKTIIFSCSDNRKQYTYINEEKTCSGAMW